MASNHQSPLMKVKVDDAAASVLPVSVSSAPATANVSIMNDFLQARMENGMNQNVMNGLGPSGTGSGARRMIQTPGMSQQLQEEIKPLGVTNSSTSNMLLEQQTSGPLQSVCANCVRAWEGDLFGEGHGQPVFLTKLKGYRMRAASETLAEDWPPMMQIVRLISQDHMYDRKYVDKADFLVFWALNKHGFLGQLQEKKLCAVIQLPLQTLLLSVSDKSDCLLGMLFLGFIPSFLPCYITALDTGASSMGLEMMGGTPVAMHMSNTVTTPTTLPAAQSVVPFGQSGIKSMVGSGSLVGTTQISQSTTNGSNISGSSNNGISQPLVSPQGAVSIGQSPGQGNLSGGQIQQAGIGMNQNTMNVLGSSGISYRSGTINTTPGMSKQVQARIQPLGVTNSSTSDMPLPQQTSGALQSALQKCERIWEGTLVGHREGQPVVITKLEGYRFTHASGSDTFSVDWPPTMQIQMLISVDHIHNKQYEGKADFFVFRALCKHGFLGQLQEKKLCAVIKLPSKILLLWVSDKASRLIGMLLPEGMCIFGPQIPSQQQQHQQQQQLQHVRPTLLARSELETGSTSTGLDLNLSIQSRCHAGQVGDSKCAKKPKI